MLAFTSQGMIFSKKSNQLSTNKSSVTYCHHNQTKPKNANVLHSLKVAVFNNSAVQRVNFVLYLFLDSTFILNISRKNTHQFPTNASLSVVIEIVFQYFDLSDFLNRCERHSQEIRS